MKSQAFFDKLFADFPTSTEQMVRWSWIESIAATETAERNDAQRLVDWYNRSRDQIVEYLKSAAAKTFDAEEIAVWQFPIVNGVPRILKRLSMAYRQPPKRTLARDGEDLEPDAPEYEMVFSKKTGMFKNIDLDRKYKEMDRWSNLLNTIHTEVVPRKGAIDWDIKLRPSVLIIPDPEDYLQFVQFAYKWAPYDVRALRSKTGWVYWTEDQHIFAASDGKEYGISLPDGANPYDGQIPIVTVRKIEQDDYWGRLGADLVDAFQATNIQFANMWENAFLQTHGQPIATNLGFKTGEKVKVGPRNPFSVEGLTKDDVPPSLTFAKPDSDIELVKGMIDWYIKMMANSYGLPPAAWSLDQIPESGFAKFMDSIELLENRDDDMPQWIKTEEELFDKSRMVWNRWASESGNKKIPEDLELKVTFPPVSFPESPTEEVQRWTMLVAGGFKSTVDYFMEVEGLDEEAALERAIAIKESEKEVKEAGQPEFAMPPGNNPFGGKQVDEEGNPIEDEEQVDEEGNPIEKKQAPPFGKGKK